VIDPILRIVILDEDEILFSDKIKFDFLAKTIIPLKQYENKGQSEVNIQLTKKKEVYFKFVN